jgi:hypothetical protein
VFHISCYPHHRVSDEYLVDVVIDQALFRNPLYDLVKIGYYDKSQNED